MKRRIELSKLEKESVIIEQGENFEDSLFTGIYDNVENLLRSIIAKNSDNGFDITEIENIISFEGRRGTGKTSAMRSVHEALKGKNGWKVLESDDLKNISFHMIDYIDASTLERGEELLEIILANMFYEVKKVDSRYLQEYNENERRELYGLFDEIYGNLIDIKKDNTRNIDISPLSLLNQLSNSQILKNKIRKLVRMYFEYIVKIFNQYYRTEQRFLVISVDDIDMHFQNNGSSSFDMLETLHRYFMIPGVIIMLTYDYSDLYYGCQKHFESIYPDYQIHAGNGQQEHTRDLAAQYLKKILPINSRIHMPSLKKSDYSDETPITVIIKKENEKALLGYFATMLLQNTDKQNLELHSKRFVFLLKASVAELYYDAVGEKRHFIDPTDHRDLSQIYVLYMNLYRLKEKNERSIDFEDKLFKEILDNLYFQYAKTHLDALEQKKFNKYLEIKIENRNKEIISDIDRHGTSISSKIVYKHKMDQNYSYGELLYYLYEASQNELLSKDMICCILDSYTTVLTKYYRKIKAGDARSHQKMLRAIGDSVAGGWSNQFLPEISIIKELESDDDFDYQIFPWDENDRFSGAISYGSTSVQ